MKDKKAYWRISRYVQLPDGKWRYDHIGYFDDVNEAAAAYDTGPYPQTDTMYCDDVPVSLQLAWPMYYI